MGTGDTGVDKSSDVGRFTGIRLNEAGASMGERKAEFSAPNVGKVSSPAIFTRPTLSGAVATGVGGMAGKTTIRRVRVGVGSLIMVTKRSLNPHAEPVSSKVRRRQITKIER